MLVSAISFTRGSSRSYFYARTFNADNGYSVKLSASAKLGMPHADEVELIQENLGSSTSFVCCS